MISAWLNCFTNQLSGVLRNYCVAVLLLFTFALQLQGQEKKTVNDTIKTAKTEKNFRFSILGGPGYTPDFGFLLGGSTLFTFRMDASDLELQRSVVPVAFAFTLGNGMGFSISSRPQLYFNSDRFRIFGQFIFRMTGDNYYGVGFNTNKETQRGEETTLFDSRSFQFNPVFLFRVKSSDFFMGPVVNFTYDKMLDPSPGVLNDPSYVAQGGDSISYSAIEAGPGLNIAYDTRDVPSNAYSGIFLDFRAGIHPEFLGNNSTTGLVNIDYRQYLLLNTLGDRRLLAWTLSSKNAIGDVPITRLPFLGSPFDLRGYYLGQYRDKSANYVLAEYRHMINTTPTNFWSKMAGKLGFAIWAGAGFLGPKIWEIEGVLPNYGAGLRIELQPRMNFRLDIGHSPLEKQNLIYFNMTEAF
jgi:Omp85 superfamily domain